MFRFFILFLISCSAFGTTIAIIDTGFDLDHDFLRPKIFKQETDEEGEDLQNSLNGWQFHDNSHLKEAVIKDQSTLQEVLLYRNLKAKGHREGLSLQEFEWFKRKKNDKRFLEQVRSFKKHTHGTFVAGVALREGENINIFPIRGLNIPVPVVAVHDESPSEAGSKIKNPEERFKDEIMLSSNRVIKKFSKICKYLALNKIEIVNASYGITYKNIMTRFREKYREITGKDIEEMRLKLEVDRYFEGLYRRGTKIINKYPDMLFVFSAGNSNLNNDEFHHWPSKIRQPNTITVAAMNGDFLASFSNYGQSNVDIGAPGVAVLSLLPKIYASQGKDLYSPSSGTSMAVPFVSNLAAQVKNSNPRLTPAGIKSVILETGDEKEHLKGKLSAKSIVNNQRAIKAALLSQDMPLPEAIQLAKSGLIPIEDSIRYGQPPAVTPESVLSTVPVNTGAEFEDDNVTSEASSPPSGPKKVLPDNSAPPASALPNVRVKSSDPVPSSQSAERSPPPGEDSTPSSSQPQLPPPPDPDPIPSPSSP